MKKIISIIVISVMLLYIAYYSYNSFINNSEANTIKKQIEFNKEHPTYILKEDIQYRKRIFRSGYDITIGIKNNSKITSYKDFQFVIKYFGESGTYIDKESFIIYKILKPLEEFNYEHYYTKSKLKNVNLKIELVDAIAKTENIY